MAGPAAVDPAVEAAVAAGAEDAAARPCCVHVGSALRADWMRDHPSSPGGAQHRPSARPSYISPEILDATCTLRIALLTPMMLFQDDLA